MTLLYDKPNNGLKIKIESNNETLLSDIKMLVEKHKPLLNDETGITVPLQCNLHIDLIDETLSILF